MTEKKMASKVRQYDKPRAPKSFEEMVSYTRKLTEALDLVYATLFGRVRASNLSAALAGTIDGSSMNIAELLAIVKTKATIDQLNDLVDVYAPFEHTHDADEINGLEDMLDEMTDVEPWFVLDVTGCTTSDTNLGGGTLRYRRAGARVSVAGGVNVKYTGANMVLAVLPTEYAPKYAPVYFLKACSGKRIARINVAPTGEITLEWICNIADASNYTSAAIWVDMNMEWYTDGLIEEETGDGAE